MAPLPPPPIKSLAQEPESGVELRTQNAHPFPFSHPSDSLRLLLFGLRCTKIGLRTAHGFPTCGSFLPALPPFMPGLRSGTSASRPTSARKKIHCTFPLPVRALGAPWPVSVLRLLSRHPKEHGGCCSQSLVAWALGGHFRSQG